MLNSLSSRNDVSERWKGIHLIALVGLCMRLALAFFSDNIYHPDEIYQYLEQGHHLAFGYGYIPWEYRFGLRSFIIPSFISLILSLCSAANFVEPDDYILAVKFVFCVISTSLIYSAYFIARKLASELAGRMAAIFAGCWYELVYFAHKPTPEILAAYCVAGMLVCAIAEAEQRKPLLFGALAGLVIVLRLQFLPVVVVIVLVVCIYWQWKELFRAMMLFLLVICIAGGIDFLTWGEVFASYYNNYLYNKIYNLSSVFGTEPISYYFQTIFISSAGLLPLVGFLSLSQLKKTWLLLICIICIIATHSVIPHKEYRFIVAIVPLLIVLLAIVVTELVAKFVKSTKQLNLSCIVIGVVVLIISVVGGIGKLPAQQEIYTKAIFSKTDMLQAYKFLYGEPDLVAVLSTYYPLETGGYYYLHRNIPVYFTCYLSKDFNINKNNINDYVSHIICSAKSGYIEGFNRIAMFGDLAIYKQAIPPSSYMKFNVDLKNIYQQNIDDKYEPNVKQYWN